MRTLARTVSACFLVSFTIALYGCGGGGGGGSSAPPAQLLASASITSAGGSVSATTSTGAINVSLPANTVVSPTIVTITAASNLASPVAQTIVPSTTYDVEDGGTALQQAIAVQVKYAVSNLATGTDQSTLVLYQKQGSAIVALPSTVDTTNLIVTGMTRRTGIVAVGGSSVANPVLSSTTVDSTGGTVTGVSNVDSNNSATLAFPAGALTQATPITVSAVTTGTPAAPTGLTAVPSSKYDFSPSGTAFQNAISATIQYDIANLGGVTESSIGLYTATGVGSSATWTPVAGAVVNTVSHQVTAPLTHFSVYGLFGTPSGQASTLSGTLVDAATGLSLSGITVTVQGTGLSAITSASGAFSLTGTFPTNVSSLTIVAENSSGQTVGTAILQVSTGIPPGESFNAGTIEIDTSGSPPPPPL